MICHWTIEQSRSSLKMTEDQQRQSPKEHKSIHDIRNQDLVSRLLAATPPYLYSAPVGPNNFFFSDMLRSLVQARNNENARNLQLQQSALGRRARKRSWSQHRPFYEHLRERKDLDEKIQSEKPLELTNKQLFQIPAKYAKTENKEDINSATNAKNSHNSTENGKLSSDFEQNVPSDMQTQLPDPATASLPPSELVLPPPPPVWYPPLYPPYGIDPLHFFIDLRVSGHIYDRKKENSSPLANADNNNLPATDTELIGKHRHGSAFTVPAPRNDAKATSAINLTSTNNTEKINGNNYAKYYDLSDSKENQSNLKNPNYVLQNLPRIYTHLTSRPPTSEENSFENDSKSDQDIDEVDSELERDTATLIDVELIDNVKNSKSDANSSQNDQVHQID